MNRIVCSLLFVSVALLAPLRAEAVQVGSPAPD